MQTIVTVAVFVLLAVYLALYCYVRWPLLVRLVKDAPTRVTGQGAKTLFWWLK